MIQVAQGLAIAHQHGLFHGLLKPSNIMIGRTVRPAFSTSASVRCSSRTKGESLVDTMSTANTLTSGLDCASPESIMEPTNRTPAGDQYSLGCVLYFCLSGRYPFPDGTAVEKMMAHQFKQPTPLREVAPEVPDGLVAVVDRLTQKSPDKRYAGVEEIVEALEPFVGESFRRGSSFGSMHGSQFGSQYGSQSDSARVPSSQFGSRPGYASVPPSQAGSSPSQFANSPSGQSPVSNAGGRLPVAEPAAPTARPAQVSRAALMSAGEPARAVPVLRSQSANDRSLPLAQAVDTPPPASNRTASHPAQTWEEPRKAGGVSVFLVFLIAALVTVGVYLLGKNFLFTG